MDNVSINIELGEVSARYGKLSFKLVVKSDMQGILQIYGYDPTDMRKSGVLLQLDAKGYSEFKQIMERVELTISKMEGSSQMIGMTKDRH